VVIVDVLVNVVNGVRVEAVKVTSVVLELSMAVIVIIVLVGSSKELEVFAVVGLGVTVVGNGPGAAVVEGTTVGVTRWPGGQTVKTTPSVVNAVGSPVRTGSGIMSDPIVRPPDPMMTGMPLLVNVVGWVAIVYIVPSKTTSIP
jgi:hypothetical protein